MNSISHEFAWRPTMSALVGPAAFGKAKAHDQIDLLTQIGMAVLLLKLIHCIGPVALAAGLGQLAFTILLGFLIVFLFGKDWLEALCIAGVRRLSNTSIYVAGPPPALPVSTRSRC